MNKIYLFLFLVLLSACGGGGGGGSVEVTQNGPPTITNNTFTFSVLENQNLVICYLGHYHNLQEGLQVSPLLHYI